MFTIIKNSEANTGWNIPDLTFEGVKPDLLCGWTFELRRKDGTVGWSDTKFVYGDAEEAARDSESFWWDMELAPTGRVIFRGYYHEYYDPEERDWYVEEA